MLVGLGIVLRHWYRRLLLGDTSTGFARQVATIGDGSFFLDNFRFVTFGHYSVLFCLSRFFVLLFILSQASTKLVGMMSSFLTGYAESPWRVDQAGRAQLGWVARNLYGSSETVAKKEKNQGKMVRRGHGEPCY